MWCESIKSNVLFSIYTSSTLSIGASDRSKGFEKLLTISEISPETIFLVLIFIDTESFITWTNVSLTI